MPSAEELPTEGLEGLEKIEEPEALENFEDQTVVVFAGSNAHGNAMTVLTEEYLHERGAKEVRIVCGYPETQSFKFYDYTLEELEKNGMLNGVDRAIILNIPLNLLQKESSRTRSQDALMFLSAKIDTEREKAGKEKQDHNIIFVDCKGTSQFDNPSWLLFGEPPQATSLLKMQNILVKTVDSFEDCRLGTRDSELALVGAIANKEKAVAREATPDLEKISRGLHVSVRESSREAREHLRQRDWEHFRGKAEILENLRPPFYGRIGEVVFVESAHLPTYYVNQGLDLVRERTGARYAVGIVRKLEDTKFRQAGVERRPSSDVITITRNWKDIEGPSVREVLGTILSNPFYNTGTPLSAHSLEDVGHVWVYSTTLSVTGKETETELEEKIRAVFEKQAEPLREGFQRNLTPLEIEHYKKQISAELARRKSRAEEAESYDVLLFDDLKFATLLCDLGRTLGMDVKTGFVNGTVAFDTEITPVVTDETDDRQVFTVSSFFGILGKICSPSH